MANYSYYLHTLPRALGGSEYQVHVTFYTSRGNSVTSECTFTAEADTKAGLAKVLKAYAKSLDDAETAALAVPKTPHKMQDLVGVRIDATAAGIVPLAPADTPVDTGLPPAAGG